MADSVSDHAVFLVGDGTNASQVIGTCFFVHVDAEKWYFVTCQHVVDSLQENQSPMYVGDAKAELAAPGKAESIDLAVLSVSQGTAAETQTAHHLRQTTPLRLSGRLPKRRTALQIVGHRERITAKIVSRSVLSAEALGEDRVVAGGTVVPAFNLSAPRISPGYSGSPVLLKNTREVVGIAMLQEGKSNALALSPAALPLVWPEMGAKLLAKSSAPLPAAAPAPGPEAQTMQGFLVAGDIADFSLLSDNKQLAAWLKLVSVLDFVLDQAPFVKTHSPYVRNLNADSFIIAFPAMAQSADQDSHAGLIHFAESCVRQMAKGGQAQKYPIRIALHEGGYQVVRLKELDDQHVIGTAVNDCQRLLGVSDIAGYIVASDHFVNGWSGQLGTKVYQYFRPSKKEPSVQVFLKRDHPQGVRMYVGGRRRGKTPPERTWLPRVLSDRLDHQIENLAAEFLDQLQQTAEEKGFEMDADPSLRASLFVPRQLDGGEHCLCSTNHRHILGHGNNGEGKTIYSLAGDGAGPAGRAFHANKIQVLHKLPAYEEHPHEYLKELLRWGVDADMVKGFGRHSRAFIDIPFGITDDKAAGVLCIDAKDPLDQFSIEQLHEAAEILAYGYNYGLIFAALWQLRTQ